VTRVPAHRRDIGMVFQTMRCSDKTAFDNVAYGLRARAWRAPSCAGGGEGARRRRAAGTGRRYPAQLSGGQRQRVALAARW